MGRMRHELNQGEVIKMKRKKRRKGSVTLKADLTLKNLGFRFRGKPTPSLAL